MGRKVFSGELYKRVIVSSLLVALVVLMLAFSAYSWASLVIALFTACLGAVGVWEYAQLAIAKGFQPAVQLMMALSVAEVLAFYVSLESRSLWPLPVIVLIASVITLFIRHFRDTSDALVHIAVEFFGVCYIAIPLSLIVGILYPHAYSASIQEGRWWFVYLIFVTKITDVGAYFIGKLWGRHKLAPVLSPKKTVEGAVAGFLCAWIGSLVICALGNRFSKGSFSLSYFTASWLGILLGVVGQVGDLAESLLKRDAVVKDSNRLPGLGGVLDMLDSLLLTAPIVFLFLCLH